MNPAASGPLARRAAGGLAWLIGQSGMTKLLGLATQLILARLLLKEDFGLFGLAVTVASLSGLVQPTGVRDVLVVKQARFIELANPGMWLSIVGGLATGLIMIALAPFAAWFYRTETPAALTRIIGLLALAQVVQSVGMVSAARLTIDMRFRALTVIGVLTAVVDTVLKIALAWKGHGALSFAVAMVGSALFRTVLMLILAPVPLRWHPEIRLWKHLLGDSVLLIGAMVCYQLIAQGDYIVLGRLTNEQVVGLYFFSFSWALQTITMISANIAPVLLPAFSQLSDEGDRRRKALLRALFLIGPVFIPLCFAQAAIADPLVRLLFGEKWHASVPLIQLLSIGMAWRTVSWPVGSYLQAQGRFAAFAWLGLGSVCVFLPVVILGARLGDALGTAAAVALFYPCITAVNLRVTLRDWTPWKQCMLQACLLPALLGGAALSAGFWLTHFLWRAAGHSMLLEVARIGLILGVGFVLYLGLFRWLAPRLWQDLFSEGVALLSPRLRRMVLRENRSMLS